MARVKDKVSIVLSRRYIVIVYLLCLMLLTAMQIVSAQTSDEKVLSDYIGVNFKDYYIDRLERADRAPEGIIKLDEVRQRMATVLYFISSNPYSILNSLKLTGIAKYLDENLYVYTGNFNGVDIELVVGDLGDFLIKVGDGTTGAYMSCNLTDSGLVPIIAAELPLGSGLVYQGQYGEMEALTRVGMVCNSVNGTFVCRSPSNSTVERILYNPYEVYYVNLHGQRLEPPIRIRCSNPEYNGGLKAVYVEGFIPRLVISRSENLTLDMSMAREIVDLVKSRGVNISEPDELIVRDIYYALAPGQRIIPVLVLIHGNTIILVGLHLDGPMYMGEAAILGIQESSRVVNDQGLRLDWNQILSNVQHPGSSGNEGISSSRVAIVAVVAVAISLAIIMWVKLRTR